MFICIVAAVALAISSTVSGQSPCYTPEGISGQCISVYQCPNVLAQFQGRLSPTTTYYLRLLQCESGVGQYPHVCCIAPTIPQQQVRSRTRSASTRLTPLNRQSSGAGNVLPTYGMCGLTALSQRIIGGDDTQLDDYPWMAILEYQSRNNRREKKLSCGGSLINTRYVLTAAHCLVGEIEKKVGELVGVRLGEYDTTKEIDCLGNNCADPVLYMGVDEKIPHERYNERSKNRENDIGLVRMNGDVTYTDYIRPICLPTTVNSQRSYPNEKLVSAGWGRTLEKRQSATKQSVELPLFDQAQCTQRYRTVGIDVGETQLCAGGIYAQDTCDGDSGNSLMKVSSNVWVVEGIVSFGRGCGVQDWPAVYTRVSAFDQWIRYHLRA